MEIEVFYLRHHYGLTIHDLPQGTIDWKVDRTLARMPKSEAATKWQQMDMEHISNEGSTEL